MQTLKRMAAFMPSEIVNGLMHYNFKVFVGVLCKVSD